ncbi:MAG: hypothetical protein AAGF59_12420 [Pseudomonadota bacterium]
MRSVLINSMVVLISVVFFCCIAELGLRLAPVDDGLRAQPVNAENPVFHFRPNRELTWSRGPTFDLVNRIRINNVGFVNDQDYTLDDPRPLLAVVGDSQVEAAMVPYADTLHGRLANKLDSRVYSFAASGAPLSQYVVWAKHAREKWGAAFLVVVVIGNDFDESLMVYKQGPGFHHYVEDGADDLVLERVDYKPNPLRVLVRQSALARYLFFNVQIQQRLQRLKGLFVGPAFADEPRFAGNTNVSTEKRRVDLSKAAVDAFLRDLQTVAGWDPANVVFVLDGFRYRDRADIHSQSYFGVMRTYFMDEAEQKGFKSVDMDRSFFPDFELNNRPFEYPTDGHWNGYAHGLVEAAIRPHVPDALLSDRAGD